MIDYLLFPLAALWGYGVGLWVTRGQERQRSADIIADLTRGWETLAGEHVKQIAELEGALSSMSATCSAWKKVAEERKRMLEELT